MSAFLADFWHIIVPFLNVVVAISASCHVILNKRDSRSAIGWIGIIWLSPFVGSVLYVLLGINRIRRRATRLRTDQIEPQMPHTLIGINGQTEEADGRCRELAPLVLLVGKATNRELLDGNSIKPLKNGDEAFPAMLDAIERAEASITMCTYIFDNDRAGKAFARELKRAADRGVEVRVLVDDVGSRYSWPPGIRLFNGSKVKFASFLPTVTPWKMQYWNIRNHRKLLVVDGVVAFTGGINIREGNYFIDPGRSPIQDIHFQIEGPVVHQLQEVFALDWCFTTGEHLEGDPWYGPVRSKGNVLARSISHGPDEEIDHLHHIILGAISCASRRITIVTPYFIPDQALISCLNTAAMRGIEVDIVIPEKGNVRAAQWASNATISQLMESGCRVWHSPPPFDHTKLMIVDDCWSLIGSANWDQRSLRLNFELNVECYDQELARHLLQNAQTRIAAAKRITEESLMGQPLPIKLRNGIARLASPYL